MTRDQNCWACLLWPVNEDDAALTFNARLAANHGWSGGQHIYGSGLLRLPRTAYGRDDLNIPHCSICGAETVGQFRTTKCERCDRSPLQGIRRIAS
jgi:hypothetical protein